MRKILAVLMVILILFSIGGRTAVAVAESPKTLSMAMVYWMLAQILASVGISVGASNIKIYTWEQWRRAWEQSEIMEKLEDYARATPLYWIFEASHWEPKTTWEMVKIAWKGIEELIWFPRKVNATKDEVEAIVEVYEAVYGEDGTETQQGNTPVVKVPQEGSNVESVKGYYFKMSSLTYGKVYTTASGKNAYNHFNGTTTQRSVSINYKHFVIDAPIIYKGVTYENACLIFPYIVSQDEYSMFTDFGEVGSTICWCIKGSECYNAIVSQTVYSGVGLSGYIVEDKAASVMYRSNFTYDVENDVAINTRNPSLIYPIFNGLSGTTKYVYIPLWDAPAEFYTGGNYYRFSNMELVNETHLEEVPLYVDVNVQIDYEKLASTITGWNDAYGNGYTEGITITLGNSITELETATVYGLQGVVDGANANTQAIINAIAAAQAAAAAAGATAGDIPLHEMTLPQQIATRFPFCIPFDLYNAFADISSGRSAPHWVIPWTVRGVTATIDIDFTMFETWALVVRWGLLVAFNIGLILITRKLIRG